MGLLGGCLVGCLGAAWVAVWGAVWGTIWGRIWGTIWEIILGGGLRPDPRSKALDLGRFRTYPYLKLMFSNRFQVAVSRGGSPVPQIRFTVPPELSIPVDETQRCPAVRHTANVGSLRY